MVNSISRVLHAKRGQSLTNGVIGAMEAREAATAYAEVAERGGLKARQATVLRGLT